MSGLCQSHFLSPKQANKTFINGAGWVAGAVPWWNGTDFSGQVRFTHKTLTQDLDTKDTRPQSCS